MNVIKNLSKFHNHSLIILQNLVMQTGGEFGAK